MNEELFTAFEALTFDDVLIVPGYTEVLPDQTDVSAQLTPGIRLNIPLLSAAMDTVTEARLAIALAREGGLGIIHRNLSPEDQAAEVDKVKRSQSGMIVEPITLPPDGHAAPGRGDHVHLPHQRRAHHRGRRRAGRHPHQPRHPLCRAVGLRAAGQPVHDPPAAGHRAGGHQPGRCQAPAAEAPHRKAAPGGRGRA